MGIYGCVMFMLEIAILLFGHNRDMSVIYEKVYFFLYATANK